MVSVFIEIWTNNKFKFEFRMGIINYQKRCEVLFRYFIILILFHFSYQLLCGQSSQVYYKVQNYTNKGNLVFGDFAISGAFYLTFSSENFKKINVVKFDDEYNEVKRFTITPEGKLSSVIQLNCYKEKVGIAYNEWETTVGDFAGHLLLCDTNLNQLKDTNLLDTALYTTQRITFLEQIEDDWIGILFSSDRSRRSDIFSINDDNSISNIYSKDSVLLRSFRIQDNGNRYLLFDNYVIDGRYNRNAMVEVDSLFRTKSFYSTDTTLADTSYWDADLRDYRYVLSNNVSNVSGLIGNLYPLVGDTLLYVSSWGLDTFSIPRYPTDREVQVVRLAWFKEGKLLKERFVKQTGTNVTSVLENLAFLHDGSIVVCGTVGAPSINDWIYGEKSYFRVVKYDRNANLIWEKDLQLKDGYYLGHSIVASKSGHVAITGTYFDFRSPTPADEYYAMVVFLDETGELISTYLPDFQRKVAEVNIYPNPATTSVTIDGVTSIGQLVIFNTSGQKVLEQTYVPNTELQLDDFRPGTYVVSFSNQQQFFRKKLLVR